ncbi:DUF6036 family nucleotidyltransferase (plasmid) [Paenibacillus thiaminolyticus]|uniref:DUF6036 family nucleotidyltransferase n=1 Tax=Paenibacillus thiaminolyticus TaxID=49283 RepID=UPI00232E3032|nr:DUF6036 family nucleotidyltransferase [Paenibacillus thiaminolyticus]WCF11511.1 DUF6036 family nucleotidyltransferase [Paenibacillus thiaminolyticus]
MNSKSEIMENFYLADQFIQRLFPDISKLQLIIVGGASFLLKGFESKFTLDIDTISILDSDVQSYLESFSINSAASEVITLSKTYYERTTLIPSDCKVLELRVLSNEDLVLAKIGRSKSSDIMDILDTGIMYEINFELLEQIAKELEAYNYDNFKHKWQDFKQTILKTFKGE